MIDRDIPSRRYVFYCMNNNTLLLYYMIDEWIYCKDLFFVSYFMNASSTRLHFSLFIFIRCFCFPFSLPTTLPRHVNVNVTSHHALSFTTSRHVTWHHNPIQSNPISNQNRIQIIDEICLRLKNPISVHYRIAGRKWYEQYMSPPSYVAIIGGMFSLLLFGCLNPSMNSRSSMG